MENTDEKYFPTKKKRNYKIIINSDRIHDGNTFAYTYRHTLFTIRIARHKATVEFTLTSNKRSTALFTDFKYIQYTEALKKVCLLHILLYDVPIKQEEVYTEITNSRGKLEEEVCLHESYLCNNQPFIFSIIDAPLRRPVNEELRTDAVLQWCLASKKSTISSSEACLYSLLLSKCQVYETQRFLYLWTAMNGFYNKLYRIIESKTMFGKFKTAKNKEKELADNDQIKLLSILFTDSANAVAKTQSNEIALDVRSVLRNLDLTNADADFFERPEIKEIIEEKITCRDGDAKHDDKRHFKGHLERLDISAYAYMLLWMPYWYRCSRFHGNTPVQLFSLSEENEIILLRTMCNLIDDFLSKNFYLLLDTEALKKLAEPKIELAKELLKW